jgi:hypothetical protein
VRRDQAPDEYEYEEEEPDGRWTRGRSSRRRWARIVLLLFIIPLLIGAGVAFFAGRPIAFYILRRVPAHKFPNVKWV